MSNTRVGEHSLEAVLHNSGHISDDHRQQAKHKDDLNPARAERASGNLVKERQRENPQQRRKTGCLDGRRHKPNDRSGAAGVNVWSPHVERHGSDFEGKRHEDKNHPDKGDRSQRRCRYCVVCVRFNKNRWQTRRLWVVRQDAADLGDVGRPGRAVDQGDPVEQDTRGQSTQNEVFHGRFGRQLGSPQAPCEHIDR